MSSEYKITFSRAARFALLPGDAERLIRLEGSDKFRKVTACILCCRYTALFSTLFTIVYPEKALFTCTVTLLSSYGLYRFTKIFMDIVDN